MLTSLFIEKIFVIAIVVYGTVKLLNIISLGRQLSLPHSRFSREVLIRKKIDSWSLSVCVTVITIVVIVAVAYNTPHSRPTSWLFLAHRFAAGAFLVLFLLLRWQNGVRSPTYHRALGYIAATLYLFIVTTGGYYLAIL